MGCGSKMEQWVPTKWHGKMVPATCGQTSIHGTELLCRECEEAMEKRYPQGWNEMPGDICKHGNYVGTPGGPDYLCGQCEDGD